jgi:hypothetical protein
LQMLATRPGHGVESEQPPSHRRVSILGSNGRLSGDTTDFGAETKRGTPKLCRFLLSLFIFRRFPRVIITRCAKCSKCPFPPSCQFCSFFGVFPVLLSGGAESARGGENAPFLKTVVVRVFHFSRSSQSLFSNRSIVH